MIIDAKLLQLENIDSPISVTPSDKTTDDRLSQLENTEEPMDVALPGIEAD